MTPKELRIGNYVYDSDKYIVRKINEFNKTVAWFNGGGANLIKDLTAIPLTEEWLLIFGFEKCNGWDDQVYWRKKEMDLLVTNQGFEMPSGKICEFVHILQNAYFFTELEELTLNK